MVGLGLKEEKSVCRMGCSCSSYALIMAVRPFEVAFAGAIDLAKADSAQGETGTFWSVGRTNLVAAGL
jgi:hypothetical protein